MESVVFVFTFLVKEKKHLQRMHTRRVGVEECKKMAKVLTATKLNMRGS